MTSQPVRLAACAALLLLTGACSQSAPPAAQQSPPATAAPAAAPAADSPFEITATIRELMDSTVDPSADALWDAVSVVSTRKGEEEHKPRTDEEWKAVRRAAVTLMESMNLVVMEGRHAAPPGTAPGEGELTPDQIDQKVAANRAALVGFAKGLRASAAKALVAIDKKDAGALLDAGGDIDEACEVCHVTFWYPNQKVPSN
jgi:hypothetical protein